MFNKLKEIIWRMFHVSNRVDILHRKEILRLIVIVNRLTGKVQIKYLPTEHKHTFKMARK